MKNESQTNKNKTEDFGKGQKNKRSGTNSPQKKPENCKKPRMSSEDSKKNLKIKNFADQNALKSKIDLKSDHVSTTPNKNEDKKFQNIPRDDEDVIYFRQTRSRISCYEEDNLNKTTQAFLKTIIEEKQESNFSPSCQNTRTDFNKILELENSKLKQGIKDLEFQLRRVKENLESKRIDDLQFKNRVIQNDLIQTRSTVNELDRFYKTVENNIYKLYNFLKCRDNEITENKTPRSQSPKKIYDSPNHYTSYSIYAYSSLKHEILEIFDLIQTKTKLLANNYDNLKAKLLESEGKSCKANYEDEINKLKKTNNELKYEKAFQKISEIVKTKNLDGNLNLKTHEAEKNIYGNNKDIDITISNLLEGLKNKQIQVDFHSENIKKLHEENKILYDELQKVKRENKETTMELNQKGNINELKLQVLSLTEEIQRIKEIAEKKIKDIETEHTAVIDKLDDDILKIEKKHEEIIKTMLDKDKKYFDAIKHNHALREKINIMQNVTFAQLESKKIELENEVAKLKVSYDSKTALISIIQGENEKLGIEKGLLLIKISDLEDELLKYKNQIKKKYTLAFHSQNFVESCKPNQLIIEQKKVLLEKLNSLEREIESLKIDHENDKNHIKKNHQSEIGQLEYENSNKIKEINNILNEKSLEIKKLESTLQKSEFDSENLASSNIEMLKTISLSEDKIKGLKQENESLQKKMKYLKETIIEEHKSFKKEADYYMTECNKYSSENEKLRIINIDFHEKIKKGNEIINDKIKIEEELRLSNNELQRKCSELEKTIASLEKDINKNLKSIGKKQNRIEKLRKKKKKLARKINELKNDLENANLLLENEMQGRKVTESK